MSGGENAFSPQPPNSVRMIDSDNDNDNDNDSE